MKTPNTNLRVAVRSHALAIVVLLSCTALLDLPSPAFAGKGRKQTTRTHVIPPNVDYVDRLRAAKTEAQAAERGIWARPGGLTQTPADYRRR